MLLNCFLMPLEIPFTHSSVGSHRPIVGCNACKHHITGFAVLQDHIGVHGFGETSVVDNRQKHTVLLRSFFLRALDLQIFARLRPVHYFSFCIAAKALNSPNLTNHIDHTSLSTVSFTSKSTQRDTKFVGSSLGFMHTSLVLKLCSCLQKGSSRHHSRNGKNSMKQRVRKKQAYYKSLEVGREIVQGQV